MRMKNNRKMIAAMTAATCMLSSLSGLAAAAADSWDTYVVLEVSTSEDAVTSITMNQLSTNTVCTLSTCGADMTALMEGKDAPKFGDIIQLTTPSIIAESYPVCLHYDASNPAQLTNLGNAEEICETVALTVTEELGSNFTMQDADGNVYTHTNYTVDSPLDYVDVGDSINFLIYQGSAVMPAAESGAEIPSYTEGTYYDLTYYHYGDHIEIVDCAADADVVEIPSEIDGIPVTVITGSAFNNARVMKALTIPASVTAIHTDSLAMLCDIGSLTDIYYDGTQEQWEAIAIDDPSYPPLTAQVHYTLENYTTGVYNYMKYRNYGDHVVITGCASQYELPYVDLVIPNEIDGVAVTEIGAHAFYFQQGLNTVEIPFGIERIGDYAFGNCRRLTALEIPDSVTWIGENAFYNCYGLTTLVVPGSVEILQPFCFAGCAGLTSVVIEEGVSYIMNYAFAQCSALSSLSIPSTVTEIGANMLESNSALTDIYYNGSEADWESIVIENSNGNIVLDTATIHYTVLAEGELNGLHYQSFGSYIEITGADKDIVTAEIPAIIDEIPVTSIAATAFYDCEKLESVTIPNTVTNIGSGAFRGCTALTSVTIPDSVTTLDDYAFMGCTGLKDAVIGRGLDYTGMSVFASCKSLENVTLPATLKDISLYAFAGCTSLRNIELPVGLEGISHGAFSDTALESITIPDTVWLINDDAFANCNNLTTVHVPASVTNLGQAFSGEKLTSITVDENNTTYQSIDGVVFWQDGTRLMLYPSGREGAYTVPEGTVIIDSTAFRNATGLTAITMAESVVTIMDNAFYGCTGLTEFHIPAGVESIRNNIFCGCSNLESITIDESNAEYQISDDMLIDTSLNRLILCAPAKTGTVTVPDGVTSIFGNAFYGCDELTEIILPDSVESIGYNAFQNCSALETITMPPSLTEIHSQTFENCTNLKSIVIPDGVTIINDSAFANCENLTEITIPASVNKIGEEAFMSCPSLTTVNYAGSEVQWDAITIGLMNEDLTSAKVNFNAASMLGDINGDGVIDATDASNILLASAQAGVGKDSGLTDAQTAAADLNGDGEFNATDAAFVLQYAAYQGSGGTDSIEVFLEGALNN